MPNGFDNLGIKGFYAHAKAKDQLPKDTYALMNQKEFFAVTASIFLAGKDSVHDPKTRETLKEKMPDYYKYLVELFGFDPATPAVTPVASAD
jgi:Mlc titration factor MtfA (ptsG expression regulator)